MLPLQGVSCIAEIILVMRYVELRAHLHRVIAVVKVRNALIDSAFHKFTITNTGIVIDEDASEAEQILAEAAQQTAIIPFPNARQGIAGETGEVARILVVEDEFGIAEVLQSALTDAGHDVMIAINGRQGLERLKETRPDLVILDFMMPVLDGPGMLREMRNTPSSATFLRY